MTWLTKESFQPFWPFSNSSSKKVTSSSSRGMQRGKDFYFYHYECSTISSRRDKKWVVEYEVEEYMLILWRTTSRIQLVVEEGSSRGKQRKNPNVSPWYLFKLLIVKSGKDKKNVGGQRFRLLEVIGVEEGIDQRGQRKITS